MPSHAAANFDFQSYLNQLGEWFLTSGIRVLFIIVGTLILLKAGGVLIAKIESLMGHKGADAEYKKRAGTLSGVIRWILRIWSSWLSRS